MSAYPLTNANPAELNQGVDREIDELPPGVDQLLYAEGAGVANPGRRARWTPPPEVAEAEVGTALSEHDRFQGYGGWEPTNAVDADPYLYNTSDRQPAMPLEITAALRPAPGRYRVKKAEDLDYSGLFDTDHIDPRLPESQANLRPAPLVAGASLGPEQVAAKLVDDLAALDHGTLTMNTLGDGSIGDTGTAKEAVLRGVRAARRRYRAWR